MLVGILHASPSQSPPPDSQSSGQDSASSSPLHSPSPQYGSSPPPPTTIFTHPSTLTSIATPSASDKITFSTQAAPVSPSTSKTTNTPLPAGMASPVKLNPKTVVSLLESINPAASAAPPLAELTETPDKLN